MVNMGNDGDIAYRLCHRGVFSFFVQAPRLSSEGGYGLGAPGRRIAAQCGNFHSTSSDVLTGWQRLFEPSIKPVRTGCEGSIISEAKGLSAIPGNRVARAVVYP